MKDICLASSKSIAHLVNQKVASEVVALQILTLLLERPTDDGVKVAVGFMREVDFFEFAVGFMREVDFFLLEESTKASNAVFERFRAILHEGQIEKRTQYMVEVLFQARKDKFVEHKSIPDGLDIVKDDKQITHAVVLTDDLDTQDLLNVSRTIRNFLTMNSSSRE